MCEAMISATDADLRRTPAPTDRHEPDPRTVESEFNTALEWQFGGRAHCDESISRYLGLTSGRWFDAGAPSTRRHP